MSNAQDTKENTEAIKDLTRQINDLNLKCEKFNSKCDLLAERLAIIQRLVYGVAALILTGVVLALLKTIGI